MIRAITAVAAMLIGGLNVAQAQDRPAAKAPNEGTQNSAREAAQTDSAREAQQQDKQEQKQQKQQDQQQQSRQGKEQAGQSPQAGQRSPAFVLVVPVAVPVAGDAAAITTATRGGSLAPDSNDIRKTLADATEAITKGEFDSLVRRLNDADRNRIGASEPSDATEEQLEQIGSRIRDRWQAKFNQPLDIDDWQDAAYPRFPVVQGVIGEAEARQATVRQGFEGNEPEDYNIEAGREVAVMPLTTGRNLPELILPFIDELGGWKIDIPNTINGQQLADNLAAHLTIFAEELPNMTSDAVAAQHLSHHVAAAMMGVKATGKGGSGDSN